MSFALEMALALDAREDRCHSRRSPCRHEPTCHELAEAGHVMVRLLRMTAPAMSAWQTSAAIEAVALITAIENERVRDDEQPPEQP